MSSFDNTYVCILLQMYVDSTLVWAMPGQVSQGQGTWVRIARQTLKRCKGRMGQEEPMIHYDYTMGFLYYNEISWNEAEAIMKWFILWGWYILSLPPWWYHYDSLWWGSNEEFGNDDIIMGKYCIYWMFMTCYDQNKENILRMDKILNHLVYGLSDYYTTICSISMVTNSYQQGLCRIFCPQYHGLHPTTCYRLVDALW
jgi:hypothetical protein